jgi:hypothetical protein
VGSPAIEVLLQRWPGPWRRTWAVGPLALSLLGWHLALGQAPAQLTSDAHALPRFTMREIVSGRTDSLFSIPGAWVEAATAARPESLAILSYVSASTRSGLTPLDGETLQSERYQHVMGLYRRAELRDAIRRTLESIRRAIPADSTRARFDSIFLPRGEWIIDFHDAALAWSRSRAPGISWDSARVGLTAAGLVTADDSTGSFEEVPRALYGLTVLAANDSLDFAAARDNIRRAGPRSATPVLTLLGGYQAAQRWVAAAIRFFLTEPWSPVGGAGRSLGDYIRADWRGVGPPIQDSEPFAPDIIVKVFGYPQAVPQYGVPPALFRRLVRAENSSATQWLEQHGAVALLRSLRMLPVGDTSLSLLQPDRRAVRISSVPRQAQERLNGFLEPRDAIAIDPGYSPVLALGALIHEWQHIEYRRRQLTFFAETLERPLPAILELPGVQPYLAEGFAEWSTERILGPLTERWPLLGLSELEKRAGLALQSTNDQHALGYALVHELARVLKDPAATTRLLLRHPESPSAIAREPRLRSAWARHARARDYFFAAPASRVLIPEVTFTIEDGYPDVIGSRILVPPAVQPPH